MKELQIKLTGQLLAGNTVVAVDGEPVRFKKNEFGNIVSNYRTDKDRVNVKVFRMLDVGGIFWFLAQLFFFLISIFGIFDVHRKERCIVIDYEAEIELGEVNSLVLRVNRPQENSKAVEIETELSVREISNVYYVDAKAKKKLKALRIAKLILAAAVIAIIVIAVVAR